MMRSRDSGSWAGLVKVRLGVGLMVGMGMEMGVGMGAPLELTGYLSQTTPAGCTMYGYPSPACGWTGQIDLMAGGAEVGGGGGGGALLIQVTLTEMSTFRAGRPPVSSADTGFFTGGLNQPFWSIGSFTVDGVRYSTVEHSFQLDLPLDPGAGGQVSGRFVDDMGRVMELSSYATFTEQMGQDGSVVTRCVLGSGSGGGGGGGSTGVNAINPTSSPTPIPEPSSWGLMGIGLGVGLGRMVIGWARASRSAPPPHAFG